MEHPAESDRQGSGPGNGGEVVELRLHGVGGTSLDDLLGVPHAQRVAGDDAAGFFRPPAWIPVAEPQRILEGYSWGALTSRARARALWLVLLPFALVNLSGWMFETGVTASQLARRPLTVAEHVRLGMARLYGLVLTSSVWVYASVIVIDLISYQCGALEECAAGRWYMWPWQRSWVAAEPARGIAVGAGLLALAVLGLGLLTRRSQEFMHPGQDDRERFTRSEDPTWRVGFRDDHFWRNPQVAHRLGLIHTSAALATVGATAAFVLERMWSAPIASFLSAAFIAILVLDGLLVLRLEGVPERVHRWVLAVTGLGILGLETWAALFALGAETSPGPAPDATLLARWTFVMIIVILLLLLVGLLPRLLASLRRTSEDRTRDRGERRRPILLPVVLLTAAVGPINAVGSGLLIASADLLGDAVPVSQWTEDPSAYATPIVYADVVGGTAIITVLTLLVFALVAMWAWRKSLANAPDFATIRGWYRNVAALDPNEPADVDWADRVGKAVAIARLTDRAAFVVTVTGVAVAAVALVASVAAGFNSAQASLLLLPSLHEPASYLLGLLPVGSIWLLNRSYSSPGLRRGIGTFWDVATFWPRWFHPWAPPSYGERAVPQLRQRLHNLASSRRVILSAHSQGTAIALATLASMLPQDEARDETLRHTILLTHGCPLDRLYARYFPDYFDQNLFTAISDHLGDRDDPTGWYNVWRETDYIGGRVFASVPNRAIDFHVLDPETPHPSMPGESPPPIRAHSDYYQQAKYQEIIAELVSGGQSRWESP